MRTRSSLLRASWARRSDSRPAHLMVLSCQKNMIIGFYLWKKNESQLRIPPCIRHLCWRVFLTDQLCPNQKYWYSFFCISRMYWNHFKTPLFRLHFNVSKANNHQRNPDLINTWKGTQAGQNSTPVLSSLLTGSTLGCSTPPLLGPAPSSCSSHGLTGAFSPFMEFRDLLKCYNLLADSNHLNIFCFVLSHAGKGDRVKLFFY